MSDNPYVNFYTSDFLAGTGGMTAATKGVYITLLCLIYETEGPLPQKWGALARRCGCSLPAFKRAVDDLVDDGKIEISTDGIWSLKCEKHITQRRERQRSASVAAKKRWEKTEQKQGTADAPAMRAQCQPEPEPEPDIKEEEPNGSSKKKRGSRLPDDWVLPKAWGDWAVSEGMSPDDVRFEALQFKDYWIGKAGAGATKRDWEATWRTWIRKHIKENGTRNDNRPDNRRAPHHTRGRSAHDSLLAGFGAFARGDGDGSGFDPDGGEATSHASDAGLDRWQDGYASQPVLRVIGS